MIETIEKFREKAANCGDEGDADALCMNWLKLLCHDNGRDGERAEALLKVVGDLLEIDRL